MLSELIILTLIRICNSVWLLHAATFKSFILSSVILCFLCLFLVFFVDGRQRDEKFNYPAHGSNSEPPADDCQMSKPLG